MIYYQNLAYCRYLHLWSLMYLFDIIYCSPLISLYIVFLIHLYGINLSTKRIGIISTDLFFIALINYKNTSIFLLENIVFFTFYIDFLLYINVHPVKLYTVYLKNDDELYNDENFFEYFIRIWQLFLCNCRCRDYNLV